MELRVITHVATPHSITTPNSSTSHSGSCKKLYNRYVFSIFFKASHYLRTVLPALHNSEVRVLNTNQFTDCAWINALHRALVYRRSS